MLFCLSSVILLTWVNLPPFSRQLNDIFQLRSSVVSPVRRSKTTAVIYLHSFNKIGTTRIVTDIQMHPTYNLERWLLVRMTLGQWPLPIVWCSMTRSHPRPVGATDQIPQCCHLCRFSGSVACAVASWWARTSVDLSPPHCNINCFCQTLVTNWNLA